MLAAAVGLVAFAYWPTLGGGYVLDDWPNLIGLEPVRDGGWLEFWRYLVEGHTGPAGRPVALLSFALQAAAWPDHPGAFHLVNLLLHFACGLAIAALGRALARHWWPGSPITADWVAVAAAAFWLLHPLNVSTTAYIVQRMAQLATLFTLLALLAWTQARLRLERDAGDRGALRLGVGGLIAGGLAAVLSKETGVLLLAYALVLEHWVFRREPPARWARWRAALLVAPALAFVALVAWRFEALTSRALAIRDFTLLERLLSEPRALVAYLKLIVAPAPSQLTLFNDAFPVSRGLLDPATTLPALIAVLAALGIAFAWRRRTPLAFGLAWFLAGHLLESTVVPLELYFEHRNYLPMVGLLLAAAHHGADFAARATSATARRLLLGGALLIGLAFAAITRAEAALWADTPRLIATWAAEHPESPRARGSVLNDLKNAGAWQQAVAGYREATTLFPAHPGFWLDWTEVGCRDQSADRPRVAEVAAALAAARADYAALASMMQMIDVIERDGRCGSVRPLELAIYLGALIENPRYRTFLPTLLRLRARLAVVVGDRVGAAADFDRAYALLPSLDAASERFQGAYRLRDSERIQAAFADYAAAVARSPIRGRLYSQDVEAWRAHLRAVGVQVD